MKYLFLFPQFIDLIKLMYAINAFQNPESRLRTSVSSVQIYGIL